MKKNVASQKVGAQMVSATDGSAFTGAVTCYVTLDAGTQAIGTVGSGACAHEGNGYHTYAPSQAETNGDLAAFTFIGTGAVPATVQIYTTFPQTGDNFARLGAPAGASIAADIADLPTNAELATSQASADDATLAAIAALNNISAAQVNAEVVDALNVDSYAEPTGVPAASGTLVAKIGRIHQALRNKVTVTASAKTFYSDADATLWKKVLSDDATTYTEAEGATP